MYIYPENLTAKATIWFWNLNDLLWLGVLFAGSALLFSAYGISVPLLGSAVFAILTIRVQDVSILDFCIWTCRYFGTQQCFYWGCFHETI